jgi:MFS family permease
MSEAALARLATYWFGLQFVWGAILGVSLQARSSALGGTHAIDAYAVIAALGAVVGTLVQFIVAPRADAAFARTGYRRAYYARGAVIAAPALAWFYLAPDYAQLLAAFFVLQIGMNVAIGPYQAIVPDYVPAPQTGRASAWMGIFQPLGNTGGLIVAGFVSDPRIVAAGLIVVLLISWAITAGGIGSVRPQTNTREKLRIDRTLRTLVFSRLAINFGFYTLLGFLFFYVSESLGMTGAAIRIQTALIFITFTGANVIGAMLAARPIDRFDKRYVVIAANGVVALGLAALALAPSVAVAYAAAAVAGIAWGAYFIADWALAVTLLPRGAMAGAMSVWNVAAAVPQIAAPLVTVPLVHAADAIRGGLGPRAAIVLAIVEFTLGALWLLRLPKRERAH